jgi:hypothetical protein
VHQSTAVPRSFYPTPATLSSKEGLSSSAVMMRRQPCSWKGGELTLVADIVASPLLDGVAESPLPWRPSLEIPIHRLNPTVLILENVRGRRAQ